MLVLDSPWETQYNTFVPNPKRYHDFDKLVADLHAQSVRVVLWITQMVNSSSIDLEMGGDKYDGESPNFAPGNRCGFYIDQAETYLWWKGVGAAVDFTNPWAVVWWHRQQDPVLALVDGWKLDFGENYVQRDPVDTYVGSIPHQKYSEDYYRDYLSYANAKRGPEFMTLTRGWDVSYHFAPRYYARPEHAPIVWAGDNRRDWIGMSDALDTMFMSARAGYVVVGSDIGGYLDVDDVNSAEKVPYSQTTFVRWVELGAMSPFMELHGRANLTPWTEPVNPDETTAIYKFWATLHHELVPFFYSLAEEAYAGQATLLQPLGDAGDWRYTLGGVVLVAPILDDGGVRDLALPDGRWHDWWNERAYDGGTTIAGYDSSDHARLPLFVREGAILPMRSSVDVWPGADGRFVVHDEDGATTTITLAGATLGFSRVVADTTLRIHAGGAVTMRPLPASSAPVSIPIP